MRLHQHILVISVLITFVASASLVSQVLDGVSQIFGFRETEQIPCDNGCNVDEAYVRPRGRFTTTL